MSLTPDILFEDNHNLVLWKPAGLPSQAPEAIPSLESWARDYLIVKYGKKGRPYLGIPHRLDRPVSGAHYLAKSSKAAARIAEQFRLREVRKEYLALLEGQVDPASFLGWSCWLDQVRKIPGQARGECCTAGVEGARPASLEVRLLGQQDGLALFSILLQTGRMHQIRLQASSREMPVLGDHLYGSTREWSNGDIPLGAVGLHSWRLGFYHPIQYAPVMVTAELPGYWPPWAKELAAATEPGEIPERKGAP